MRSMRICRRSQLSPIALDHPPMVAVHLQGRRTRVAIIVVTTILYLLLFVPSFAFLGDGAAVLETIVARATALAGTPHGYLYLVEPATNTLTLKVGTGDFQRYVGDSLPRGVGLAGNVWQAGQPLVVPNYAAWPGRAAQFDQISFQAVVGV